MRLKEQGDIEGSLAKIAVAFDKVIDVHRQGTRLFFAERWPYFIRDHAKPSRFRPGTLRKIENAEINQVLSELVFQSDFLGKTVFEMVRASNISVLGLDYRRYTRFKTWSPGLRRWQTGATT